MSALIDPELAAAKLNSIAETFRDLDVADLAATCEHAALLLAPPRARLRSEWTPEIGDALWWHFPIDEPPYVGSPLSSDWPEGEGHLLHDGYYSHWTPIVIPTTPPAHEIVGPPCMKEAGCCMGEGHEGECDDIPF